MFSTVKHNIPLEAFDTFPTPPRALNFGRDTMGTRLVVYIIKISVITAGTFHRQILSLEGFVRNV
jgi:hypothetical protein